MNALQRASIEKAGHDNGWEVALAKDEANVTLGSSQHNGRVTVLCDEAGAVFNCRFSSQACVSELKHGFADIPFLADDSCNVPKKILPDLLRRAAQLLRSLPTAPEEEYKKRLSESLNSDEVILKTEGESLIKHRIGQNIFLQAYFDASRLEHV